MVKSWKQVERKVAREFGSERCPLSGGNSRITRSDTIHDKLFIEVKSRKHFGIWALYEETAEMALKEGKIPLVVIKQNGKRGELAVFKLQDFRKIMELIKEVGTNG